MARNSFLLFAALAAAALLGGCATPYTTLENRVQAFASGPALAEPLRYRFERLPSQAADPAQAALEDLAAPALHRAGLRRDETAPRYSVQVTARVQRVASPYHYAWDPWTGGWVGWGSRWGVSAWGYGGGWGFYTPYPRVDQSWFQREVAIVVRELAGNGVVFESRAATDSPWTDNRSVLPLMFDAALQGFPNPPAGERRVDLQVTR